MRGGTQTRRRLLGAAVMSMTMGLLAAACEPAKLDGLPKPGPSAVEVTVTTTPPGATIVIDGNPMGAGPVTVKLNPGPHRLKGAKSGYFSADQRIVVASGEQPKKVVLTLVSSH